MSRALSSADAESTLRRLRRRRVLVPVAFLALAWVAWISVRPSHQRNWSESLAVLPSVVFEGDLATIEGVRDFRWHSLTEFDAHYDTRTYDLSQVTSLWYCLSIFHPDGWQGPAHSLLSFGFADGRYLAVSVEARKEKDEGYSIYRGMAKRFELMYVLGDERDLIANRAALRPDSVLLYPIRATPEAITKILRDVLEAAERLRERPEFYHTITNNCTTRLRDHVNHVAPGLIPPSWKVVLPGYSDELLEQLDLIDADLTLEEARSHFDIKAIATQAAGADDFSQRIRAGLRG